MGNVVSPPSKHAEESKRVEVNRENFDAVLFDLDGVLTDTASLHAACWKQVFDELLKRLSKQHGENHRPFDIDTDYRRHVDGKPRLDGVRDFLSSRGIDLPERSHEGDDTVEGIARRKNTLIMRALKAGEVKVYEDSIAWLRQLRSAKMRTAVVSASRHCLDILQAAGINDLFEARVDGQVAEHLGLSGKPAPDTFLEAARRLAVDPARAVVVEDALAGVRAGRAGGFGLVIGVARGVSRMSLTDAGADVAVNTLAEMMM